MLIHVVDGEGEVCTEITDYSVEQAVALLQQEWNEKYGVTYTLQDEDTGRVHAVLLRHPDDPAVCIQVTPAGCTRCRIEGAGEAVVVTAAG